MENQDSTVDNANWIEAFYDPVAGLYTFSSGLALTDLNGDGDSKAVIATLGSGAYNMKLKVFKGTSLFQENSLPDLPTGICTFYMDNHEPRVPGVAVASGPFIYVYKNMRPYYKFVLPLLQLNQEEGEVWSLAKEDKADAETVCATLLSIADDFDAVPLTPRSIKLLKLETAGERAEYVDRHKSGVLKRQTVIVCITTIKKSVPEDDGISCVVVGTENKEILFLDSESFSVQQKNSLPDVPSFINVSGLFDVDFRVYVACRAGKVYVLKKGSDVAYSCLELQSPVVGIERIHKQLMVACMDNTYSCYTSKGKRLWRNYMPANIICTALMDHKSKGFKAVMVSLSNNEIRVYKDKFLVDTIALRESAKAMAFGKYGREESTLMSVLASGAINLQIMKRTAQYNDKDSHRGPPASQSMKLQIAKKSQLFIDQSMRERQYGTEIFQAFQQDLQRFKLKTAKTYLKALEASVTPISNDNDMPLKISATVQGLGPVFKLIVGLQNTSSSYSASDHKMATNLKLCFKYSDITYKVDPQLLNVPCLVPGIMYKLEARVECIVADRPAQDNISAIILKSDSNKPVVTASISMPASEATVVV